MTTNNIIVSAIVAILLIAGTIGVISMEITKQVPYKAQEAYTVQVPYKAQETYTVQVPYQVKEEYTVQVPYQVKEEYTVQVPYKDPVYKTEQHRDPVYETLYTYILTDGGSFGDEVYRRTNVYKAESEKTGSDFWGNTEYKWTLYYYSTIPDGQKTSSTFYEIDEYTKSSYQGIVTYKEWSEQVVSHYETKYRTETKYKMVTKERDETEYKMVTKERDETRYREVTKQKDVTKYRTVTKYRDETKTVYEWYFE